MQERRVVKDFEQLGSVVWKAGRGGPYGHFRVGSGGLLNAKAVAIYKDAHPVSFRFPLYNLRSDGHIHYSHQEGG